MKILIFTYDRYSTITTPAALDAAGIMDYRVICHTEAQRQQFIAAGRVRPETLIVSGQPRGLANNRNWAMDNLCAPGEWACMLVDDWITYKEFVRYDTVGVEDLTLIDPNKRTWGNQNHVWAERSARCFMRRAAETQAKAEALGVDLAGFALHDSLGYLMPKWRRNCLPDGRALLIRIANLRFDPGAQLMDDRCFAAQNIEAGSGCITNNWALPLCERYTSGAFGTITERLPQHRAERDFLMRRFPGLFHLVTKPGWPSKMNLRITARSPDKWRLWRLEMHAYRAATGTPLVTKDNWVKLRDAR